ncbi:MAG: hypothetical protein AAB355_00670 [Patescibacteria group bacterium]
MKTEDILLKAVWALMYDSKYGSEVLRVRCTGEQRRALFYQGQKQDMLDRKQSVRRDLREVVCRLLSLPLSDDTILFFSEYDGAKLVDIATQKQI